MFMINFILYSFPNLRVDKKFSVKKIILMLLVESMTYPGMGHYRKYFHFIDL